MAVLRVRVASSRANRSGTPKKAAPDMAVFKRAYLNRLKKRDPETYSFAMAVNNAIKRKKAQGLPIARYDEKTRRAYLEYPDGRREYVEA